jgi:formiminotetrahydrofolate cyclodeaminase
MTRTVTDYASAVASGEPTPGGGSVIATVASLAAGLAEMVCHLTLARPLEPPVATSLSDAQRSAAALRARFLDLADEDERAYGAYRQAASLPNTSAEERDARREAIQSALERSAGVPLTVASSCVDLLIVTESVARHGTKHARADVQTSLRLTDAALKSALAMVRANTELMRDGDVAARLDRKADGLRIRGDQALMAAFTALEDPTP